MLSEKNVCAIALTVIFLLFTAYISVSVQAPKPSYAGAADVQTTRFIVDLNSASAEDLCQLYGLGEKTAAAIIEYRNRNGGFKSIDEIQNVKGIGEKKLANWRKFLSIS